MKLVTLLFVVGVLSAAAEPPIRAAVFDADVTPPVGSPLCGGSVPAAQTVADPLSARGIVLWPGEAEPGGLGAVDWVGLGNGAQEVGRAALAEAAGTTPARVAVHTLHQHDAPYADDTLVDLLQPHGLAHLAVDETFTAEAVKRAADAVRASLDDARDVTHVGVGAAQVEKVASNRRILGEDGKVRAMRWTACSDPDLIAEPEGTIDPVCRAVSLWEGDEAVAVLTYYATHPQSYYRTGAVSADFPGMARQSREDDSGIPHIHFNGAGGNVAAGKYNDGSHENRPVLAGRLADGMKRAFEATEKHALSPDAIAWQVEEVILPRRSAVTLDGERERLADESLDDGVRIRAAREIAWMQREESHPTRVSSLALGPARLVHLPGELFVEYQLAAQEMAADQTVCVAAYGDYGPGYIGVADAYPQGGYEVQVYTSRTDPEVEGVLMSALEKLLAQ